MEIFSVQPGHSIGWVAKVLGNDDNGRPLSSAEMAANARLIAAAPEMLKTLRFVLPVLANAARRGTIDEEGVNLELEAAREVIDAIALAEGRE
jgi:hypothetical protein